MDQEVAKTLSVLELKLQELERELTSIGARNKTPMTETVRGPSEEPEAPTAPTETPGGSAEPPYEPPVKLIDEAVEQRERQGAAEHRAYDETIADSEGFGSPAVFGGEEVASQASGGEAGRDWTASRETAYGEIPTAAPTPPPPFAPPAPAPRSVERRSIELTELMRFRDKLVRTMDELIGEYDQLLAVEDGSRRPSDS